MSTRKKLNKKQQQKNIHKISYTYTLQEYATMSFSDGNTLTPKLTKSGSTPKLTKSGIDTKAEKPG